LVLALDALTLDLILLGFDGFILLDYKRIQRNIGGLPYNDNMLIFPMQNPQLIEMLY